MKNQEISHELLQNAVQNEAASRLSEMLQGVLRYCESPYQRETGEMPVVWQKGAARLLDYGQGIKTPKRVSKQVVLFVPSLINRYYILDLEEKSSFLRFLAGQGMYPLVLDWGSPSSAEMDYNCADYVEKILLPAINFISQTSGGAVALAGYCMGGVLACAAAGLRPDLLSSLALLATPWDFHVSEFLPPNSFSFVLDDNFRAEVQKQIASNRILPAEYILSLFYLSDPFVFERKFRRYFHLSPSSEEARSFVAMERWVNDGVAMTAGVAADCLIGWAQKNQLKNGGWRVGGKKTTPPVASMPTFIAIPKNDSIVPPSCSAPLVDFSTHAHVVRPSAGHVGMVVGRKAQQELWRPYSDWLLGLNRQ